MSILAYYLSQNLIDQIWVFAAPALSLSVYYYLTLPRMPFSEFYVVGLFVSTTVRVVRAVRLAPDCRSSLRCLPRPNATLPPPLAIPVAAYETQPDCLLHC